jgi:NTP pyrophosphatase (non-canonical NTP hydrolase)
MTYLADRIRGLAFMAPWIRAELYEIANQVQAVERALDEIVENDRQDEKLRAEIQNGVFAPNVISFRSMRKEKNFTF